MDFDVVVMQVIVDDTQSCRVRIQALECFTHSCHGLLENRPRVGCERVAAGIAEQHSRITACKDVVHSALRKAVGR